jgi:hypothetical protein
LKIFNHHMISNWDPFSIANHIKGNPSVTKDFLTFALMDMTNMSGWMSMWHPTQNGHITLVLTTLLSNLWTCQHVESNNNLENKISSSLMNSKGSCSTSSSLGSLDLMGSSPNDFVYIFINIEHWVFRQHIFLVSRHGVGAKLFSARPFY